MVTKRKSISKGLSARRTLARDQEKKEKTELLMVFYNTRLLHLIHKLKMRSGSLNNFRHAMNLELTKRYQERKYGRPELIKRTIETWIHARRKSGEFGNDYVEKFIGGSVDVNQVFEINDPEPRPWSVSHEIGKLLWHRTLKIIGVLNAGEESQVLAIMNLSDNDQLRDFIADVEADLFLVHPAFIIEPGQALNFEV